MWTQETILGFVLSAVAAGRDATCAGPVVACARALIAAEFERLPAGGGNRRLALEGMAAALRSGGPSGVSVVASPLRQPRVPTPPRLAAVLRRARPPERSDLPAAAAPASDSTSSVALRADQELRELGAAECLA